MKKLLLLPLSLILLNPGYAKEEMLSPPFSDTKTVATTNRPRPEIVQNDTQIQDMVSLHIDPDLVDEIEEGISASLENDFAFEEGFIAEAQEIATSADGKTQPRIRQQIPQRSKDLTKDGQKKEELQPSPTRRSPTAASSQTPASQPSVTEGQQQEPQKKQEPHVRRYPSQAAQTPEDRTPGQPRARAPRQPEQSPKQRPQQTPPAKLPRAQPNTVDAGKKQLSPSIQGNRAAAEQHKPAVQRQPTVQNKQPAQNHASSANVGQKKVARMNSQRMCSEDQNDEMQRLDRRNQNQNMQQNGQSEMMVNTSARPMTENGYGIWVMGDVLLWQAVEENLTYAYKGSDTVNQNNRTFHTVDFAWDWGFRLGAGYDMPRDGWDLDLYWTHIRNTAHGQIHDSDDQNIYQLWASPEQPLSGAIREASGTWRVHLDQVDLDLGREFYVSHYLTLRPFIGVRSTWLYQTYDIELLATQLEGGTIRQKPSLKNRYWGFGFVAGLDTDWMLGWGISLYGEADMALLLGFFDVDQKSKQNNLLIWHQDRSFRAGRAIVDLEMGLKWARTFFNEKFGLALKAGYEYHLYFDQNQFFINNGNSSLEFFYPVSGNLIYQGVIGSIQLDF